VISDLFITFFLVAAFNPAAPAPSEAEVLPNDKVTVTRSATKPGGTETVSGRYSSVTVYFSSGSLEIVPAAGKPRRVAIKRGDAVFQTAEARVVKNIGKSDVAFARIDFLGSGNPEMWGAAGLSPNYTMLLENQYARVYHIRIPAGAREPQHSHKDRVVVCLSGAELSHLLPDGRDEPSTLRTGEIAWRRGGTHIGRNLGKTDLWVIAVEPK